MKYFKRSLIFVFILALTIISFGSVSKVEAIDAGPCPGTPTVSYGGKIYNTVHIGTQCWLKENLNIGTKVVTGEWNSITKRFSSVDQVNNNIIEKYCYDNLDSNCDLYGGYYQWGELVQYKNGATNYSNWSPSPVGHIQGICPAGWHVPRIAESNTLVSYLGGNQFAGPKLKEAGSTRWDIGNIDATNLSGFTAIKSGFHYPIYYGHVRNAFYMWVADINVASFPSYFALTSSIPNTSQYFQGAGSHRNFAYSARCVKDEVFNIVPSVGVAVNSSKFTVEQGELVTYTAFPNNGGITPTYQWKKNGVNIDGAINSTYTYVPTKNDVITVLMNSSLANIIGNPAMSNAVNVDVTPAKTVPGAPLNLTGVFGQYSGTNLSWDVPLNNGGSPIGKYKIEYKIASDTSNTWTNKDYYPNTSKKQSKMISGINPLLGYDYRVSAVNSKGVGSYVELLSPNKITGITTTPGDKQITLNWNALVSRGSVISTINIYYKQTSLPNNSTWSSVSVSAAGTTKTITGLINSTSYDFKIIPSSPTPGPMPDILSAIPNGAVASPVSVSITSSPILAVDGKIPLPTSLTTLTFTANPVNGGTNPTYQWKKNGVNIIGATGSTYTGIAQELLQIKVVMTSNMPNVTGNPAESNAITITSSTPTSTAPGAPTNLQLARVLNSDGITYNLNKVNLTWTAPTNNGGSPITSYKIDYRIKGATSWTTATSTTTTKIIDVTAGIEYDFVVKAVNAIGTGDNGAMVTSPSKITGVTVTPNGAGKLLVSWVTPNNGGSPILEYRLRYKPIDVTPLPNSWGTMVLVSNPNATSTELTGLTAGKSYQVRVRAVSGIFGPWSDDTTAVQVSSLPSQSLIGGAIGGFDSLTGGEVSQNTEVELSDTFTTNLSYGKKHNDVKQLQSFLNSKGYKTTEAGKETTYFGKATKQALIKFQKDNNITPASGNLGPQTRALINGMVNANM